MSLNALNRIRSTFSTSVPVMSFIHVSVRTDHDSVQLQDRRYRFHSSFDSFNDILTSEPKNIPQELILISASLHSAKCTLTCMNDLTGTEVLKVERILFNAFKDIYFTSKMQLEN
jgi:hypothetical protein